MINQIRKISAAIICCFMIISFATAQKINNTLYHIKNVPQSHLLNPAIQPECKVYVGFPALSSIYLNYSNSSFAYNDIIKDGTGLRKDSLVVDVNGFHDALKTTNFISQQLEVSLFALGIRAKKMFFTLDVIAKQDFRFSFDKEMITFLKNGNSDYLGKTSNWGGLGLNTNYYHEIALGASKKINDKWTVGIKGKVLFGIANVHMEDSDLSVYTSPSGDKVILNSKQKIRANLPFKNVKLDKDGFVDDIKFRDLDADFFTNTDNKGFAVDLGVTYQLDKKTKLHASILDLGAITWKTDGYEFSQDTSFTWKGADWSQSGNSKDPNYKEIEDVFEDLTDSISDAFRFKDKVGKYSVGLPAKIYFGGTHDLSKKVNVGAICRTEIYNGKIRSALSLSTNTRFFRNLSASLSYTIANNTYTNFGFGLAAKLGPFQLYTITDNFMAGLDPNNTQFTNIRFGLNMMFGCRNKKVQHTSCSFEEVARSKKKSKKNKRYR